MTRVASLQLHRLLTGGDRLNTLQRAFIKHDGFQGDYTPGQIMSAFAVLDEIRRQVPSHVTADLTEESGLSDEKVAEASVAVPLTLTSSSRSGMRLETVQ